MLAYGTKTRAKLRPKEELHRSVIIARAENERKSGSFGVLASWDALSGLREG